MGHRRPAPPVSVRLLPIVGALPAARYAPAVIAPPFDALDDGQRAALVAAEPDSFLAALPPTQVAGGNLDVHLATCRAALARLHDTGRLVPFDTPALAVLTMSELGRAPLHAVIGDIEVAAFRDGRVRGHERLHPERVEHLARYLEVVAAASSPVCLTYRADASGAAAVAEALTSARTRPPSLDVVTRDGARVQVWLVTDPHARGTLAEAVAGLGTLTVADGHHRAAAVDLAARRRTQARGPGQAAPEPDAHHDAHHPQHPHHPDDPHDRVLCALVSAEHLEVAAFHRVVRVAPEGVADEDSTGNKGSKGNEDGQGNKGDTATTLGRLLHERLTADGLRLHASDPPPSGIDTDTMWLWDGRRWWMLDPGQAVVADERLEQHLHQVLASTSADRTVGTPADPLADLAADLAVDPAAQPLAGTSSEAASVPSSSVSVDGCREDPGVAVVAATTPPVQLGIPGQVALVLPSPGVGRLFAVSEAGGTLPPKSTYVTPKLRSGVLVVPR